MFATIEDTIYYEYKWTPKDLQICDIDDIFRYFKLIRARSVAKISERLMDYYTLVNIVHADNPGELASSFRNKIENLEKVETEKPKRHELMYDEDAGLEQLDMLKRKRQEKGLQ